MPEDASYEERVRNYKYLELVDIADHIDKEKYPDRYALVLKEIERRRADGSAQRAMTALKYRTAFPRFLAGLVDGLAFLPLCLANRYVMESAHLLEAWFLVIWLFVQTFAFVCYVIAMHAAFGQTLGKMALGVRVVGVEEKTLSVKQAVYRSAVPLAILGLAFILKLKAVFDPTGFFLGLSIQWLVLLLSATNLVWFALEVITMLTNGKRRALHDFIAGSVVIRVS